jgi:hypothetical protein
MAVLIAATAFLSGCLSASAADGFVKTTEAMGDVTDADTTIRLEFQTSKTAKKKSFTDIISSAMGELVSVSSMITSDGGEFSNAADINRAIEITVRGSIKSEFDDGTGTYISLGWVGPKGTEPIIELFATKRDLYIGSSVVKLAKGIVEKLGDGVGSYVTAILDAVPQCDWINISFDELEDITGEDIGELMSQTLRVDASGFDGFSKRILAIIKDNYGKNIKKDGKSYTLTIGYGDFASFANDILDAIEDEQGNISDALSDMTQGAVSKSQIADAIDTVRESLDDAFGSVPEGMADALEDATMSITVSDEGKGDSRIQKMLYEINLPESAITAIAELNGDNYSAGDVPEMMRIAIAVEIKARGASKKVQGNDVLTMEEFSELIQQAQSSGNDYGYDYDYDFDYDDYDFDDFDDFDYDDPYGGFAPAAPDPSTSDDWPIIGAEFEPMFPNTISTDDIFWMFSQIDVGDSKETVELILGKGEEVYDDTYRYSDGTFEVYYRNGAVATASIRTAYDIFDELADPNISLVTLNYYADKITDGEKCSYSEIAGAFGGKGACLSKSSSVNSYTWVDGKGGYATASFDSNSNAISLYGNA